MLFLQKKSDCNTILLPCSYKHWDLCKILTFHQILKFLQKKIIELLKRVNISTIVVFQHNTRKISFCDLSGSTFHNTSTGLKGYEVQRNLGDIFNQMQSLYKHSLRIRLYN